MSMILGMDEPGEPFTYAPSTYTAPASAGANPSLSPFAISYVTIEKSAAVEASDLGAFSKPSFLRCFQVDELGTVAAEFAGFASAHMKVSLRPVHKVQAPYTPGVRTVAYAQFSPLVVPTELAIVRCCPFDVPEPPTAQLMGLGQ
jgi:hypothetical protein